MNKKKNNCNNTQAEFYVPMGRVGSLVIQVPVVLSIVKVSIPISSNIDISDSYDDVSTLSNKVFLSKPTLSNNSNLSIEGYVEKKIEYMTNCNLNTNIPFAATIPVNFSILPETKNSTSTSNNYYKRPSPKISFSIDSIDIESDSYEIVNCTYENSMVISIKLTLVQNQYVFIPEPEGDVLLQKQNSNAIQSNDSQDNFYYTVGYDRNSGLIANKIPINNNSNNN
ncbi:MAG TPA: hypothetical protein DG753_13495 [Clostridium sp.]|nr:hypothetical protein [Clostridium sp.]